MQEESSISKQASESGGAESEPSTLNQEDTSTSAGQKADDSPLAEQVGVKLSPRAYTGQQITFLQPPPPTEQTIYRAVHVLALEPHVKGNHLFKLFCVQICQPVTALS